VQVAAPIDLLEVVEIKSGYQANVVSGLPSGCASFDNLTVRLNAATRLFTIEVLNLAPRPTRMSPARCNTGRSTTPFCSRESSPATLTTSRRTIHYGVHR
jgi:hypothetical protein